MAILRKILKILGKVFSRRKKRSVRRKSAIKKTARPKVKLKKKSISVKKKQKAFKKVRPSSQKAFSRPIEGKREANPNRFKVKSNKESLKNSVGRKSENSALKAKNVAPSNEVLLGDITHFFPKIQVCVLEVKKNSFKIGDTIRILGKETDFIQKVQSLQIESVDVKQARKGQLVGLKLEKFAKVNDKIYQIRL